MMLALLDDTSHAETGLSDRLLRPFTTGATGAASFSSFSIASWRMRPGPHRRTQKAHLIRQRGNLFYDRCILVARMVGLERLSHSTGDLPKGSASERPCILIARG